MIREIGIIAGLTWREARRRKIVWVGLGLGAVFIALYSTGFYFMMRDMMRYMRGGDFVLDSGFNFTLMAGFYAISFLGVMLAVLASVGTLSGEINSHTIQALAAKPMRRCVLVLGKWVGLSAMIALYIAFLMGGITLTTYLISGYLPPGILLGAGLMIVQAEVLLALSILGGTRLSTVANGVTCFMLYGLAFVGSWLEQIGAVSHNETMVDIGILTSLLVPSQAMWTMAAYEMQPAAITSLQLSPFAMATPPSPAMLVYALAYIVLCIVGASLSFSRRDL
ncbi:MAG: ABC transporter permease [Anaerolineae bacterium]|nr:ABC transporter permease [Anaerolineae bacterium]